MIEVARAILVRGRDNEVYFNWFGQWNSKNCQKNRMLISAMLYAILYSDLNTDGSFIPLGDNKWGLRSCCSDDEIDEERSSPEDTVKCTKT